MKTPAPQSTEAVLSAHITRTRHMFMTVSAMFMVLVIAMGVGSYFLYHSLSRPSRIAAAVDREFAKRDAANAKANKRVQKDVCRLLTALPHTSATDAVRNDFACPGTAAARALAQQAHSASTGPSSSPTTHSTSVPSPRPRPSTSPAPHRSPNPRPRPTPSPTPKCIISNPLPIGGKCLVP